jgi:hypothetical protein
MLKSVLSAWADVIFYMQEKRAKRYCLIKTIADIDRDNLITRVFSGLKSITSEERAANILKSKVICNVKQKFIFTNWINVIRNQKALDGLQSQAKSLHLRYQIKKPFGFWATRSHAYQQVKAKA